MSPNWTVATSTSADGTSVVPSIDGPTGRVAWVCSVCNREFKDALDLQMHKQAVHQTVVAPSAPGFVPQFIDMFANAVVKAAAKQSPVIWQGVVPANKLVRQVAVYYDDGSMEGFAMPANTPLKGPGVIQLSLKEPGLSKVGPGLPVGNGERRELPLPLLHELSRLVKEHNPQVYASYLADLDHRVQEARKVREYIEHVLEMSRIVSSTADALLQQLIAKPDLEIFEEK